MRVREIGHMNVVAKARAVGRRVVVAVHLEAAAACGGLNGTGNEMNLRFVILPDLAVRIRAGRIEVAERRPAHLVRALEMRKRALDGQFALAVTVDRALWMRFRN